MAGLAAFGNAVQGDGGLASALSKGALIGPQQRFISSEGSLGEVMVEFWSTPDGGGSTGRWANLSNRYLGLRFRIGGKVHYGWARLSVEVGNGIVTTMTGYAYETTPNKAIRAGQTQGPADDGMSPDLTGAGIPSLERKTLGQLALGTRQASLWRRP
jgi:hypothetical protein